MKNLKKNHDDKNGPSLPDPGLESEVGIGAVEPNKTEDQLERRRALYARFGYDIDRERQAVIEAAKPLTGRILEAGTGKGHFAVALARLGYRLVSFDISEDQLKIARENLERQNLVHLVDLHQENGESLSFADGSFEMVFSINMIHHLENTFKVLSELIRVLAPDGKLVISDFSPEGLAMMAEVYRMEGDEHQVAPLGLEDVKRFLQEEGFEVRVSRTKFQIILVATRK